MLRPYHTNIIIACREGGEDTCVCVCVCKLRFTKRSLMLTNELEFVQALVRVPVRALDPGGDVE